MRSNRSSLSQNSWIIQLSGWGKQRHSQSQQHHQDISAVDSNTLPPFSRVIEWDLKIKTPTPIEWDPGKHFILCLSIMTRHSLLLLLIKIRVLYVLVCNMMLHKYVTLLSGNLPPSKRTPTFPRTCLTIFLYQIERERSKDLNLITRRKETQRKRHCPSAKTLSPEEPCQSIPIQAIRA